MASPALIFASERTANQMVAGIPAAARALQSLVVNGTLAPDTTCVIAVPGGWQPSTWCAAEMARLAPAITPQTIDARAIEAMDHGHVRTVMGGEALVAAFAPWSEQHMASAMTRLESIPEAEHLSTLRAASERIITQTGKPQDGLVSRTINRPVSRAISRIALRFPGVTPMHGTIAAALIGVVMALCLFLGGEAGMVAGALLFQAASIVDGVDGEIARATQRSSIRGAMLDTLCDAATNLAFIAGLTFNLWQQGEQEAAAAGAIGLAMLALGLTMLGLRSRAVGGPFTFDVVKNQLRGEPSRQARFLAAIGSRDVYAFIFAVLVVIGFASEALIVFAVVVAGWLLFIAQALMRTRPAA